MADLKTFSVLFNWLDGSDQGQFGTTVRATNPEDAEAKGRAEMRENHIANHCKLDWDDEQIADSCAAYEEEDFQGRVIFGGEMVECSEGAIWKAADLETALRDLIAWANHMGGWEAEAWRNAEKLIAEIDGIA